MVTRTSKSRVNSMFLLLFVFPNHSDFVSKKLDCQISRFGGKTVEFDELS